MRPVLFLRAGAILLALIGLSRAIAGLALVRAAAVTNPPDRVG